MCLFSNKNMVGFRNMDTLRLYSRRHTRCRQWCACEQAAYTSVGKTMLSTTTSILPWHGFAYVLYLCTRMHMRSYVYKLDFTICAYMVTYTDCVPCGESCLGAQRHASPEVLRIRVVKFWAPALTSALMNINIVKHIFNPCCSKSCLI